MGGFVHPRASWLVLLLGCSPDSGAGDCPRADPDRQRAALVVADAWTAEPAETDPLADHRPETVTCSSIGAYPEGSAFEVQTDDCNYAGFVQPSLVDVLEGDRIAIEASHLDLVAPEPATAHIAVLLGEQILWEEQIPIPNNPLPYSREIPVTECVPSGTPVRFHLHNHGYNTWKLLSVEVIPGPD
jgi:hypothetical protein